MRKLEQHENGYELWDYGNRFVIKHKDSAYHSAEYHELSVAKQRFDIYRNQPAPKIKGVRAGL